MERRIAVIEDEASIAASVAARLRAEGFEVETAADGITGVDLCAAFRPDLVVLDLMLPPRLRFPALAPIAARLEDREPLTSANLSRRRARAVLATRGPG
jgi:DNA-binding response OmpR family regulator